MTIEEGKKAIEELKAQGNSEEEIAGAFYLMFVEGKIDVDQFDALVNLLGYHLTDEFKNMSPEDQKEKGFEEKEEDEDEKIEVKEDKKEEEDEEEEKKAMRLMGIED